VAAVKEKKMSRSDWQIARREQHIKDEKERLAKKHAELAAMKEQRKAEKASVTAAASNGAVHANSPVPTDKPKAKRGRPRKAEACAAAANGPREVVPAKV